MPPDPLPDDVLSELQRGNTIEAIKRLRQATGLGLKEAKDAVDAHRRQAPAGAAGGARPAPGEVPRSAAGAWPWALALAVVALLAWLMLGRKA